MTGYATMIFSYDPSEENSFSLTVCITEIETQNFLGIDFCQNQASRIQFDLPCNELRQPPKTFC